MKRTKWNRQSLFLFVIGANLCLVAEPPRLAWAEKTAPEGENVYFVNTTSDTVVAGTCANGLANCSLRGAIAEANNHPGADRIRIDLPAGSIINLTNTLPDVTESVSIIGPGSDSLTVRRSTSGIYGIFKITTTGTVALSGMTISNGSVSNGAGAGISNSVGTVNVTACILSGNSASNNGAGGGIFNNIGTVNVINSTFTGNSAVNGGGIFNGGGTMTVTNSTLSSNTATDGGGIYSSSGTATITSSTLSGNTVSSTGGGIHSDAGAVNITSSTISNNGAGQGGGIDNTDAVSNLKGTIIARNTASIGPDLSGAANSQGHNLIGNNSGAMIAPTTGDQIGTAGSPINPMFDPAGLQNNGGPTQTIALLSNSPAIDVGDPNAPARDQRYYLRNNVPEIGAFEFHGMLAPISSVSQKMHGTAGTFTIDLPLAGPVGVECRSGGANGDYQLTMSFATPVSMSGASVTNGIGSVGNFNVTASQVTVDLTGVINAQQIVLTLFGVNDGSHTNNVNIPMGILLGDTTGNGIVNASDVSQTKAQLGQPVTNSNFRSDVNVNGTISASDVAIVKSQIGTAIP